MSKLFAAMSNRATTYNGAVSNKNTADANLDFFRNIHRGAKPDFLSAFRANRELAIVTGFYAGDVRGGQGERQIFRDFLNFMLKEDPNTLRKLLPLIPEYTRWDVLTRLIEFAELRDDVVAIVRNQLEKDMLTDKPSLLGKWMPSENASSKDTRKLAYLWVMALKLTVRQYRQILSTLRSRINVLERLMSANEWGSIDYSRIPSVAHNRNRKAFAKRDNARYAAYLARVESGEEKINAGALYPYDIVAKYIANGHSVSSLDRTLEAQWKALPDYASSPRNALVVCDVSGSMYDGSKPAPITVAMSLAVYIAERNNGLFKDKFITFSANPELQNLRGDTLRERLVNLSKAEWGGNTDVARVFELILNAATRHKLPQSEMPEMVYIVSDMQFDHCGKNTNLDNIRTQYSNAGYTLPTLVFWNVTASGQDSPALYNDQGVMLVSGASPVIFEKTINAEAVNPYDLMIEVLSDKRYDPIRALI